MPFDVAQADRLLTTTRTVRWHLDFDREVDVQTLLDLIDVAEQAPSGSNQASRRWLIVRDPGTKKELGQLYRAAGGALLSQMAQTPAGGAETTQRVLSSAAYLAENFERVPALVLLTIHGVHDNSGRPSLFDSVIQSGWSFCLAARARGLGTAWTTLHLQRAEEAAELLGLPPGVTQIALIAVGHCAKDDFAPVRRRPAKDIAYFDHWGFTDRLLVERAHAAHGRGVTVELDVAASAERVWRFVTDIGAPGRHSAEGRGARWTSGDGPALGATFLGANATDTTGHPAVDAVLLAALGKLEWETTCTVVACEPGREFAYVVGDVSNPPTRWSFTIEPLLDGSCRVAHSLELLAGLSGTGRACEANPDAAEEIVTARFRTVRANMTATLRGIRDEAQAG